LYDFVLRSDRPPSPYSMSIEPLSMNETLKRSNSLSSISSRTTIINNPLNQSATLKKQSETMGLKGTSILPVCCEQFLNAVK